MICRFSRSEIAERSFWANNFRVFFGFIFFLGLVGMNLIRWPLPVEVYIILVIGLSMLSYSLLAFYLIRTTKLALNELIIMNVFLGVVDFLLITAFVYFSGGYESPYFAVYLMLLAAQIVTFPFAPVVVFWWASLASGFYVLVVLLVTTSVIPFYSRFKGIAVLTNQDIMNSINSLFVIPAIIFFFAAGLYWLSSFLVKVRCQLQNKLENEAYKEKQAASFSEVSWTLTHVTKLGEMLDQTLTRLLAILGVSSGLIMMVDQRSGKLVCKVKKGISPKLLEFFHNKTIDEVVNFPVNLKGFLMDDQIIDKWLVEPLDFRHKKIGLLVILSKEGEPWLDSMLEECLTAAADELAAAIFYGSLIKGLTFRKKSRE